MYRERRKAVLLFDTLFFNSFKTENFLESKVLKKKFKKNFFLFQLQKSVIFISLISYFLYFSKNIDTLTRNADFNVEQFFTFDFFLFVTSETFVVMALIYFFNVCTLTFIVFFISIIQIALLNVSVGYYATRKGFCLQNVKHRCNFLDISKIFFVFFLHFSIYL